MKTIWKTSDIAAFKCGFVLLMLLSFSRPIMTVMVSVSVFPIHKLLPAIISYLLIVSLVCSLNHVKIDIIAALIMAFCLYSLFSIGWGSEVGDVIQTVLPFVCFFSVRTFGHNSTKVRLLISAHIVGYILPILVSSLLVFQDASVTVINYWSKVVRQEGLYDGVHTFAHAMLFFSFFYGFLLANREHTNRLVRCVMYITFPLSVYCLVNTYVRSAFLGFLAFWALYPFRRRKFTVFLGLLALLVITFCYSSTFETVLWKTDERDLDRASSGRITLWSHNLDLFTDFSFYTQMMGSGLGSECKTVFGDESEIWSSHNDYISLLMTQGVIGLLLYGAIIFVLVRDIIRSRLDTRTKAVFLSTVFAVSTASAVTNGYLSRFELNQMFWLFMGCSYNFHKTEEG